MPGEMHDHANRLIHFAAHSATGICCIFGMAIAPGIRSSFATRSFATR